MTEEKPAQPARANPWMLASIGLGFLAALLLVAILVLFFLRPGTPSLETGCSTDSPQAKFARLNVNQPSYELVGEDVCFLNANLFLPVPATGTATVRVGDATILTIDVANFDNLGKEGAGSGERDVSFPATVRLRDGHRITLDLGQCSGCEGLSVLLQGGPPSESGSVGSADRAASVDTRIDRPGRGSDVFQLAIELEPCTERSMIIASCRSSTDLSTSNGGSGACVQHQPLGQRGRDRA